MYGSRVYVPLKMTLYDAHCHISAEFDGCFSQISLRINNSSFKEKTLLCMSTNQWDCSKIDQLSNDCPSVVPCFGIHPWYTHLFTLKDSPGMHSKKTKLEHYSKVLSGNGNIHPDLYKNLPEPTPLEHHLQKLENYLKDKDYAIVGEIGLDKAFRVPWSGYFGKFIPPGTETPNKSSLSTHTVRLDHQIEIFRRMLLLAQKYSRPISLHCVKAQGNLFDLTSQVLEHSNVNVCLHSYTGSVDQAKAWLKKYKLRVFFSFSKIINVPLQQKNQRLIDQFDVLRSVVPMENVLIETDLGLDRYYDGKEREKLNHVQDLSQVSQWFFAESFLDDSGVDEVLQKNFIRYKTGGL